MASTPTIALFSGYYPSHGGGIEIVCGKLAEGLARRGHRVLWCALDDQRAVRDSLVERRPLRGSDMFYRLTGTPMPLPGPSALRRIWGAVAASDIVLIAEANFVTNALAFLAAKLIRRPVIVAQHLGMPSTASALSRLLTRFSERCVVRPMLRGAGKVAYVSTAVQNFFRDVRTRDEALVIGHGVDTSIFRPPACSTEREWDRQKLGLDVRSRIACFVGRCTESKGVGVIAEMARRRPDFLFVIAGSGPVDPRQWKLPNVVVLGHLEPERLASLYRASDLLVLPSPSESFSLTVREALACDTSVLCGDTVLLTDSNLEHYVEALPVDISRPEETAVRFARALDGAAIRGSSGAAYVARTCSWDEIVSVYAEVIGSVSVCRGDANLVLAA